MNSTIDNLIALNAETEWTKDELKDSLRSMGIEPEDILRKGQITVATEKAAYWLALGNAASERGDDEKAERHYERAQKWQDKMNELLEDTWPSY